MDTMTPPTRGRVSGMLKDALLRFKGDLDKTTAHLVEASASDNELREQLLWAGARDRLMRIVGKERESAVEMSTIDRTAMPSGTVAAQSRAQRMIGFASSLLLEMPIAIGGMVRPLKDWTGVEIDGYASGEIDRAKSSLRNAFFLRSVAKVAGEAKVGAALNEAALLDLKAKAEEYDV